MKMKINIYLFVCQLILFFSCANIQKNEIDRIDELNVEYVSLSILTSSRVDCKEFESYFNKSILRKKISSREILDEFSSYLRNLNEIDSNYYPYPDTRIKIEVSVNDSIQIICIGNLVVRFEDKSYINDKKFKQLLSSMLE